ncbi:lutropin-choriogonadotropic hormone receptor-like isoform X3 [Atheta coriaria]|uniref:lutropin-choriogonadotropic hormone receptor-like isoform X3 n=1 Tax=Dalotia coriaria TaxID=877792 RepID=UPI0031F3D11B
MSRFWMRAMLLACIWAWHEAAGNIEDDSGDKLFTIDSSPMANNCTCVNEHVEVECRCSGHHFYNVPSNLTAGLSVLIIEDAGLEVLKRDSLMPYSETLRELTLVGLEKFYYFEPGVFRNLSELETLYIHRAPKLLKIQPEVFSVHLPKLKILRIVNTGLEEMPNLNGLHTASVLHMIDLEHNRIQRIKWHQISRVKTDQLLLNYNDIRTVEEEAFYGSEIAKLSLKGNVHLANLHRRAFGELHSLRHIDLSSTAITAIPLEGLREIDVLKVQDTETLKVFPSVYNFQYIKEAWLTYPYHCCAFKFPHTHNPREFEQHQRFIKRMQSTCSGKNVSNSYNLPGSNTHNNPTFKDLLKLQPSNATNHQLVQQPQFVTKDVQHDDDGMWSDDEQVFHNGTLDMGSEFSVTTAVCGEIYRNYHEVKCYPAPDAFNPCEDLMGNWGLRIPVWFISLSAIIGNLFVVIVIATSHFRLTVSKFLMCNLAAADLCIGIHLLLIAVVDACSIGAYFNYAIDWQEAVSTGFLYLNGEIWAL